jgi:hypothetical protein
MITIHTFLSTMAKLKHNDKHTDYLCILLFWKIRVQEFL